MKYSLKKLKEATEELEKEYAALLAKQEEEIKKRNDALNIGVLNKEYGLLLLPDTKVHLKEIGNFYHKKSVLYIRYPTAKVGLWGHRVYEDIDFQLSDEGVKQLHAKLNSFLEEDAKVHAENLVKSAANTKIVTQIQSLISACGFREKTTKYDSKKRKNVEVYNDIGMRISEASYPYQYVYIKLEDKVAELVKTANHYLSKEKEEVAKKEAEEKAKKMADPLLGEAIIYLAERKQKVGVEFKAEDAVALANQIAFDEAVKEKVASDEMFSFSGDDYCEDCNGWDGQDRRCSCGNRRVSWERADNFSFKNPVIDAIAY